jgi:hypothetical protein
MDSWLARKMLANIMDCRIIAPLLKKLKFITSIKLRTHGHVFFHIIARKWKSKIEKHIDQKILIHAYNIVMDFPVLRFCCRIFT